jgi:hypothetical protein
MSKTCNYCYNSIDIFIRPLKRRGIAVFRDSIKSGVTIYWNGWKPIFKTTTKNSNESDTVSISFFRWTYDPNKLMVDIEKWINELHQSSHRQSHNFYVKKYIGRGNRHGSSSYGDGKIRERGDDSPPVEPGTDISLIKVAKFISWNSNELGEPEPVHPMSLIALNEQAKEAVQEIHRWKNSEDWYKERNIPWKRGLALSGTPGNGKSTLARLLAVELNMRLNVFDISTMDNKEFQEFWRESLSYAPSINLIEDIDAVFDGRKNVINPESGLTFDCLLNTIDGVESSDGILTIISTNHIEKLDSAIGNINGDEISTRPGRIDRVVIMTPPDEDGRRLIANRILKDYPDKIEKVVQEGNHDSGAQFQERCSRLALKLYWQNKSS